MEARITAWLIAVTVTGCVATSETPTTDPPIPPIVPPGPDPVPTCPEDQSSDPGYVALRRLNRVELDNTTRDLIGTETAFSSGLPAETLGHGFDNLGEFQTLSPLELELYENAGQAIIDGPLAAPKRPIADRYEAELLAGTNGNHPIGGPDGDSFWFNTIGWIASEPYAFERGIYRVTVRARGLVENMIVSPEMYVTLGSQISRTISVDAVGVPDTYQLMLRVEAEVGDLRIAFANPYYEPVHQPLYQPPTSCVTNEDTDSDCLNQGTGNTCIANICRVHTACAAAADCAPAEICGAGDRCGARRTCCLDPRPQRRELWVDWFEIEGPIGAPDEHNALREVIVDCALPSCAREVLQRFARRAYRRPVDARELDALVALVEMAVSEGDTFDAGIDLALRAILLSPSFLFKVETDPDPTSAESHPLGDHELATRLSYFLWSTMPDEELTVLAGEGRLHEEQILRAQIDRMLADPKARELTKNLGGQWLQIRSMADTHPSTTVFPEFDDELRDAMKVEAELYFASFLDEDRSIPELLVAKESWLNDRLASHYGLPPVGSTTHVKASLDGSERMGLLTQGGALTLTSNPDRTSVVKRGKWILEQLLCIHPPPPPPNVEGFSANVDPTAPLRERMAQHRDNPVCSACHSGMDPLGFALEKFDAVGRFRVRDEFGNDIDATGVLPDGRSFDGAEELAMTLANDPLFLECSARNVMTYAVGRGFVSADDTCTIEQLTDNWSTEQYRFKALVRGAIENPTFLTRRGGQP